MEVVDHAPHDWFLLNDGPSYFLDVNCNVSAVGFSLLVQLTDGEQGEYQRLGRAFIQALAQRMQDRPAHYAPRNVQRTLGKAVSQAIVAWRSRL